MRTRHFLALALAMTLNAGIATAADNPAGEHRQLGAHQHGHGTLGVAIEGKIVEIELISPGADIVGFEHPATSDADSAAIDKATKTLEDALALFTPSAAAGCTLKATDVQIEAGEHGAESADQSRRRGAGNSASSGAASDDDRHTEFRARYRIFCSAPEQLKSLTVNYFKTFKAARELEVQVIGPKGQTKYQATPDNASVPLGGVM